MSHTLQSDSLRPEASDTEGGTSDTGSFLAASNIIDQYAYTTSEASSSSSGASVSTPAVAHAPTSSAGTYKHVAPDGYSGSYDTASSILSSTGEGTQSESLQPAQSRGTHAAAMDKSLSKSSMHSDGSSKAVFNSVEASPSLDTATDAFGSSARGNHETIAMPRNGSAPPIVRPPPRRTRMTSIAVEPGKGSKEPLSHHSGKEAQLIPNTGPAHTLPHSEVQAENDASSSDGSHYDDQTEETPDLLPSNLIYTTTPTLEPPPEAAAAPPRDEEIAKTHSNTLESPEVPRRHSSAQGSISSMKRPSHDFSIGSPAKTSLRSVKTSKSTSSFEHAQRNSQKSSTTANDTTLTLPYQHPSTESPKSSRKSSVATVGAASVESTEYTARQQAEIEQQLAASSDSSRPRTLKEARALAKERAKQRMEAARGASEGDGQAVLPSLEGDPGSKVASDTLVDKTEPGVTSADDVTQSSPTRADMADLQTAIGDALQDVSFTSSTATGSSSDAQPPHALRSRRRSSQKDSIQDGLQGRSSSLAPHHNHVYRDIDSESNTGASATSTSFDSARESPVPTSPWSNALSVESSNAAEANVAIDPKNGASPRIGQASSNLSHTGGISLSAEPHVIRGPAFVGRSAGDHFQGPATPTSQSRIDQSFTPHAMPVEQRNPLPNKIARLDVYGKTVAWPPAFDPSAIIEQKRLAPWERARSYAHYCNDLCTTPTGLQIWLTMVQRPAQRQIAQQKQPFTSILELSQPLRAESSSGYANSIRSEATFPTRGDGGRAKELRSHNPSEPTISEDPADRLPSNLPYPLLAQRQQDTSTAFHQSTQNTNAVGTNSLGRQQGRNVNEASQSHGPSTDRLTGRNFFQSLGRRGSVKKSGGSGSVGMNLSPLLNSSPRGAATTGTPTKSQFPSGQMSSFASQPSLALNERQSPSMVDASPRSGGTKVLSSQEEGPLSGGSASMSSSFSRASPLGPRAPSSNSNSSGSSAQRANPFITASEGHAAPETLSSAPSAWTSRSQQDHARFASPKSGNVPLPSAGSAMSSSVSLANLRDMRRPSQGSGAAEGDATTKIAPISGLAGVRRGSNSLRRPGEGKFGKYPLGSQQAMSAAPASGAASSNLSAEESAALDKLSDVLPDADRTTLLKYLRRANGNDLVAIGDYLQDRSKGL